MSISTTLRTPQGWTLDRYTLRFKAESGDGAIQETPDGGSGWTRTGAPPRTSTSTGAATVRAKRRRPPGILTIPSCATVGQALRDLAAADVLSAPVVDACTREYVGWVSCGSIVQQLLHRLYPVLLNPDLLSQEDIEATLSDESLDVRCMPQSHFECMAALARAEAPSAWTAIVRATDDGDTCFQGFADTTLLDFVSRGLDVRPLSEKRIGDFDPCHRIGVFTEMEPPPGGDADIEGGAHADDSDLPDMRPRWVSVVSQLDVIDLMVRDADSLGAFPHVKTMLQLGFATDWGTVMVTSTFPTMACLALMHNAQVSGVAVLDRDRRFLIGSLSLSDIRRVDSPAALDDLHLPVGEFLRAKVWSETPGQGPKSTPGAEGKPPPGSIEDPVLNGVWRARCVTVAPDAPLIAAMRAMSAGRVHRVYVAESPHSPPLGVCTCTDVMRIFAVDPGQAEGRYRLTW